MVRVIYGLTSFSVYFVAMLRRALAEELVLCPLPRFRDGEYFQELDGFHPSDPRGWGDSAEVIICDIPLEGFNDFLGPYPYLVRGLLEGSHDVLFHIEAQVSAEIEALKAQFPPIRSVIDPLDFEPGMLFCIKGSPLSFDLHCRELLGAAVSVATELEQLVSGPLGWAESLLNTNDEDVLTLRHAYLVESLARHLRPDIMGSLWLMGEESTRISRDFEAKGGFNRARQYPGGVFVLAKEDAAIWGSVAMKEFFSAGARVVAVWFERESCWVLWINGAQTEADVSPVLRKVLGRGVLPNRTVVIPEEKLLGPVCEALSAHFSQ